MKKIKLGLLAFIMIIKSFQMLGADLVEKKGPGVSHLVGSQNNQSMKLVNFDMLQALKLANKLPTQSAINTIVTQSQDGVVFADIQKLFDAQPDHYGVIQVPVLQQGFTEKVSEGALVGHGWPSGNLVSELSWDIVASSTGGNCGYQALKNVILLMNTLENTNEAAWRGLKLRSIFFEFMRVWAPMIYQAFPGRQPGVSWLGGGEIDYLKKNLQKLHKNPHLQNFKIYQNNIEIIEYVQEVGMAAQLPINERELRVFKKLAEQRNGILGIVWAEGQGGHWVAFVGHKCHGNLKVYYMNSSSGSTGLQIAPKLFNMSVAQIDEKIRNNQEMQMLQDLATMKNDLDILEKRNLEGKKVYAKYAGCVDLHKALKETFTEAELRDVNFAESVKSYLVSINKNWSEYIAQERKTAYSQDKFNNVKNIKYAFWENMDTKDAFAWDVSIDSCAHADKVYKETLLIVEKDRIKTINRSSVIHAILSQILVGWKNISVWSDRVKGEVALVIQRVISYLKQNPQAYHSVHWDFLGEGPEALYFTGGLKEIIDQITLKLGNVPNFDAQQLRKN